MADALARTGYAASPSLLDAVFFALHLGRPLLVEGEVGTGKTALAGALAEALGRELVRLQCYEGIEADQAIYAWRYGEQLLALQAGEDPFTERFLAERPILRSVRLGRRAVFLIDEVDRADEAFEAFLLEFLQTYEVTVPELGTVRPEAGPPFAVLTSNRTRPLSDALRRRAVYHYAPLPDAAELRRILVLRTGSDVLADEVAHLVVELRQLPLVRPPGPAEAIDFLQGMRLVTDRLTRPAILSGLGLIVKDPRDLEVVRAYLEGT